MDELQPHDEMKPVREPASHATHALAQELVHALSEEEEVTLLQLILRDHRAALQDRAQWESRLAEWEDAYYNRVQDKTFPWEGASNFHVPITMMGVETYKPRLVEGVLGQKPPIFVIPSKGVDEARKDTVELFLNWQILTEMDIEATITQSAHLFLQPGTVIAKTSWMVDRVTRRSVKTFPGNPDMSEVFQALFGATPPEDLIAVGKLEWEGTIPPTAQSVDPAHVRLKFAFVDNGLQVLIEKEDVQERPHVDLLETIDFISPARGGQDIEALPWCQQRLWMYEDELRRKVQQGRFSKARVEELLEAHHPSSTEEQTDSSAFKQAQATAEGVEPQGPSSARQDQYEIIEDYRRYDIDDDGFDEHIIVWISPQLHRGILGWDYLDNVYAHGRRPFRVGRFFPVPFRFLGLSFAEVVKGLQDEINAIHNQRVDYGTLQNAPFYFYRASSTLFATPKHIKPGEGVPIDNPQQDILFPKWQGTTAWGFQEEQILQQYLERLTGLTDLSLGRQPNRVGATRTAKGTQTLLSEAGLRFKIALQAFQRFWIGVFTDILALDQEYLPPDVEFRVVGRLPSMIRLKDRLELRGKYDLRLASTSETLNRDQLRQDSTAIFQMLMNPALIQGGIVSVKGIRRAAGDLLRAYGKDPEFYLEDKQTPRSPHEELMLFASGQYVGPVAGEDLQFHLLMHQQALAAPGLTEEARQLLQRHLAETQQLQQAMQMMQQMQPRGGVAAAGGQATNAEQGRQPQPPTQSPGGPGGAGMPGAMPGAPSLG